MQRPTCWRTAAPTLHELSLCWRYELNPEPNSISLALEFTSLQAKCDAKAQKRHPTTKIPCAPS